MTLTSPPPYCDATLSGSRVQLVVDHWILFNGVSVPLPGENVLYIRLSPDGTKFAGVGHASGIVWEWEGKWYQLGQCEGMSPVIYDADGVLQIVRWTGNDAPTGAQGWRYVGDNGELIPAWKTYADLARHIWEFTDRGDITVGQGGDEGGLQVLLRGRRVLLQAGYVRNIQCYRDGDRVVIAAVYQALAPLFYDLTMADLDALPTYVLPGEPPPPPPPPPPPKDEPMSQLDTVKAIRATYPRDNPGTAPLGEDAWRCIVHIAQAIGAQCYRKEAGDRVLIPSLNVSVSRTIIGRGTLGNHWVKVLSDGEGAAGAIWSPGDTPADGAYVDVSGVDLGGDPPPPDDPPSGDTILARLTRIEAKIDQLLKV